MISLILILITLINIQFSNSCEEMCQIHESKGLQDRCVKGCRFFRLIDAIYLPQVFEFKLVQCQFACDEAYLDKPSSCYIGCHHSNNIVLVDRNDQDTFVDALIDLQPVNHIVQPQFESLTIKKTNKGNNNIFFNYCFFLINAAILIFLFLALCISRKNPQVKNEKLSIYGDGDELKLVEKPTNFVYESKQLEIKQPLVSTNDKPVKTLPYVPIQMQIKNL